MRVLIVDDEPLMKQWLEEIIKQDERCQIVAGDAFGGQQALALCKKDPPDVVFTDIRMPGMDGVELIRILHQVFPQIITVVLSNYSEYQFVRQTMLNGAFDYVLKLETTQEDILNMIDRIARRYEKTKWKDTQDRSAEACGVSNLEISKQIQLAVEYIWKNYGSDISRGEVAEYVHFNENYFSDVFKRETGTGFMSYVTNVRMEKAKFFLTQTSYTVSEIAEKTGYPDAGYFSKAFRKHSGISPADYRQKSRQKGKNEDKL